MHIEDDLLLGRARRGDRVAFAQMATRWWPPVFRLALNMLANASQASAATEETVFALLESQASSDVPIRTLVYRLALQFSLLRRRWIPPALEPSVPIREALQRLDDLDRAALLLRDVEMLPVEEVASILQISPKDVRTRAHRARLLLMGLTGDPAHGNPDDLERRGGGPRARSNDSRSQ